MAVYGYSLYGTERYGPQLIDWSDYGAVGTDLPANPRFIDYQVDPVVAESLDYATMALTWTNPTGDWTSLRVLKSFSGYAVNETDGIVLLDTMAASHSLVDKGVRPGAWHYYTLFIESAGLWQRAGGASALMNSNHGYGQRLFESLPLYQRSAGKDSNDSPVDNETLKKFLGVLGWGLDYVKTASDSLQYVNDPQRNHVTDLARLAGQMGIDYEASAPSQLFRQRVKSAAPLARERGTLEQLTSLISLTTGLDAKLTMSPNVMVTDDASSFVHPFYPVYSTVVNYAGGERVRCNKLLYECATGGAYGPAQGPSWTLASNAWWTCLSNSPDNTLVDADGAISGWEPVAYTGGIKPNLAMTLGVQSFPSAADMTSNALRVMNLSGATADLGAHSVAKRLGETTLDKGQVFKFGVPIEVPLTYTAADTYQRNTLVNYKNMVYRSLNEVQGIAPSGALTDSTAWEVVGADDRVKLGFSLYAKAGLPAFIIPAYPVIEFFDETGALFATVDTEKESAQTFDSFSNRYGVLSSRALDSGGSSWVPQGGTWNVSPAGGGVAWPLTTGTVVTAGAKDGNVSVTFNTEANSGLKQYLAFRCSATNNFLKATRTKLYSRVQGNADVLLGTYSTPFQDKDRITINFVGSAISVYRNGASVLSITSGINLTETLVGIGVN